MADSMKKQLKKEIGKLYEEFDNVSAQYAPKVDTVEEMSEDFDNMVESGMTELEAYQALPDGKKPRKPIGANGENSING